MTAVRKGIVLAGGAGSRLYPLSRVASKQLQPVYDKPMIYYPLSTLMMAGIDDILIISTPQDTPRFQDLLGDGSQWGVRFTYVVQPEPKGIAQAFLLGEAWLEGQPVCLILGDNLFYGRMGLDRIAAEFGGGAHIFGYPVHDPERYGVVELGPDGTVLSIEEKPARPRSRYAIPGLYLFDGDVAQVARGQAYSDRGELEITGVIQAYLDRGRLTVEKLGRGIAWLDTGTHQSLLEASQFIGALEARQGLKIACLEEVAYRRGFLNRPELEALVATLPRSSYTEYLVQILKEES
ncbi:MAG TPA: glucose-1-phosphate thymidylyltransferase RfbA [Candidatus Krumholzibacteria bacterium]|nr:glucose-1-phosphate thymidylyltransferase RfbA [Candidatus Krumholzibacteria bacterium]HRX50353.1 glucose-1-phosphate thymidylyltransferase RfbA [Candidatus Krumholzibacteria bacterium]